MHLDMTKTDPLAQIFFEKIAFVMIVGQRIRCSCGTDHYPYIFDGGGANIGECDHHPDHYYLHAIKLTDGQVLVWECCKRVIAERFINGSLPAEVLETSELPYSPDLVIQRQRQRTEWVEQMNRELVIDLTFKAERKTVCT